MPMKCWKLGSRYRKVGLQTGGLFLCNRKEKSAIKFTKMLKMLIFMAEKNFRCRKASCFIVSLRKWDLRNTLIKHRVGFIFYAKELKIQDRPRGDPIRKWD